MIILRGELPDEEAMKAFYLSIYLIYLFICLSIYLSIYLSIQRVVIILRGELPDEEAMNEAHRNACALLASGVTEVLACNRAARQNIECKTRSY